MANQVVRSRNYLFEALVLLEEAALILSGVLIFGDWRKGLLIGFALYFALAWPLRLTLQKHHRKGMHLIRASAYEDAIACFQKSEAFFEKHAWIDKYRFITMFATSAYSYREMALHNQAFACLRLNRPKDALIRLEKLMKLNPKRTDAAQTAESIKEQLIKEEKA